MCTCTCWHMLTWRGRRQQVSCPISLYLSSRSTVLFWAWGWTSALAILLSLSSTALGLQMYTQAHPDLRGCWESELRLWATSPAHVFKFLNIDYDVMCEQRPFHFLLSKSCALYLHLLPWLTELATVSKRMLNVSGEKHSLLLSWGETICSGATEVVTGNLCSESYCSQVEEFSNDSWRAKSFSSHKRLAGFIKCLQHITRYYHQLFFFGWWGGVFQRGGFWRMHPEQLS